MAGSMVARSGESSCAEHLLISYPGHKLSKIRPQHHCHNVFAVPPVPRVPLVSGIEHRNTFLGRLLWADFNAQWLCSPESLAETRGNAGVLVSLYGPNNDIADILVTPSFVQESADKVNDMRGQLHSSCIPVVFRMQRYSKPARCSNLCKSCRLYAEITTRSLGTAIL